MSEQVETRSFAVTHRQMAVAIFALAVVWYKWVPNAYLEDEQTMMRLALIPGALGLLSHLVALTMRFFFRQPKDDRDVLLFWRIGWVLQALAYLVYIVTRTILAVEHIRYI